MKVSDDKLQSQTGSPNSLGIAGNICIAGVVFGAITPWWLFLAIPTVLAAFTAESRLRAKSFRL